MKSYPYIGKFEDGIITLFTGHESGFVLESPSKCKMEFSSHWDEIAFTNITHEYLSNTWGVVESKEHAEFIIKLAELHGFELATPSANKCNFFNFGGSNFAMLSNEPAFKGDCKQITIPLPPKAELPEAGHNLVFAASECKEWPCVGDEVVTPTGKGKLAVSEPDEQGVVIVMVDDEDYGSIYKRVALKALKKPKTPEEALRDELISYISTYLAVIPGLLDKPDEAMYASHQAACTLLTKYSITPKEV